MSLRPLDYEQPDTEHPEGDDPAIASLVWGISAIAVESFIVWKPDWLGCGLCLVVPLVLAGICCGCYLAARSIRRSSNILAFAAVTAAIVSAFGMLIALNAMLSTFKDFRVGF